MTGVVNPFSDNFQDIWDLWKQYKWESHKFKYKGLISEQVALKQLVGLSDGDENKAIAIIEQSISREWQGFFPLKQTRHSNEYRAKQQQSSKGNPGSDSIETRVTDEFNKRFGNWEPPTNGTNLKAV